MEATPDKFGIPERDESLVGQSGKESSALVLENGVLVFTGEVEGDLGEAVRRAREARSKVLIASPD